MEAVSIPLDQLPIHAIPQSSGRIRSLRLCRSSWVLTAEAHGAGDSIRPPTSPTNALDAVEFAEAAVEEAEYADWPA